MEKAEASTSGTAWWSEEHVRAAEELQAAGPFVDEAHAELLDRAAEALGTAYADGRLAKDALDQLAGPPYQTVRPLHVMGGAGRYAELDNAIISLSWPEILFVPGGSQERWLRSVECPPAQRYASGSASGVPSSGDPHTGRAFSWAQPPLGVSSGTSSAGVFAFFRPTKTVSVVNLAPEIDWMCQSRYFVDWEWGRNYAISVQLGGAVALTAWIWNPATSTWERATNGLGGTPVSATRNLMTDTNSNVSGSASSPLFSMKGHIDTGRFTVPVLVQSGRLYAFGVHANSWWKASIEPGHPSTPPPAPPPGAFKCWTSMTADVPYIWL